MTTPTPIPHLDEPAQQLARIRRLERDLEAERANVARERKANGELALLVHELRQLSESLQDSVEELNAALSANNGAWKRTAKKLHAEAKALAAEVEQLKSAQAAVGLPGGQPIRNVLATAETAVTLEMARAHLEAGGVVESKDGDQTRKALGAYLHRSKSRVYRDYGAWFAVNGLQWMTDTPGFYKLLPITPQENGSTP